MSWTRPRSPVQDEQRDSKRPKLPSLRVQLNPADCNLDFDVEENGLRGHALCENGFAYCWSGARATVGITGGKYCFGCKIISAQPVVMEDTPADQQHVCRVGISRGDDGVGNLGETEHSFGFGGTGKFSSSGRFLDYGSKFGVGDTIICVVDLENNPLALIGFSKNGKWLGTAKQFDAGPRGLGVVNTPLKELPWGSALFPHVLLKNVEVQLQFSIEDELVPVEGYKPWCAALEDGNAVVGPTFSNPKDCEVLMMVGLPASGKTTWAEKWVKEHPEKRYVLLGTNLALDQMKVPGLYRKNNYGERFDRLMDRATVIFNTLLAKAANTPRNYILDQTNVYKSARKRKLKAFVNYRKVAVVIFPNPDELKLRAEKRFKEMGKEVPAEAVNAMLANYALPISKDMPGADEFFDQVMFPELNREEAQRHLEEMKRALGSSKSSVNSDYSPYSRESSVQSFSSHLPRSIGPLSGGGHRSNSSSTLPPPGYGYRGPHQVISCHSRSGSYRNPDFSPGGYRSGVGEPDIGNPGTNSNYIGSLSRNHLADPHGFYGGNDLGNSNLNSRNFVSGGDSGCYQGYSGNNVVDRQYFEKSSYGANPANEHHRRYGSSEHYGTPNFERQGSFSEPNFENRSSLGTSQAGENYHGYSGIARNEAADFERPGSFNQSNFENRNYVGAVRASDPCHSYSGNDHCVTSNFEGPGPFNMPNFESRSLRGEHAGGSYHTYNKNDSLIALNFERPGSFSQPQFHNPRSSFSHTGRGMHMGDPRMPPVDPPQLSVPYGLPHGSQSLQPSYGYSSSAERQHTDGYPPGPRYG